MVVDASVAVKWVSRRPGARRRPRCSAARLSAPSLWLAEAAGALLKKRRRGELSDDEARARAQDLLDAPIEAIDLPVLLPSALRIATELGDSVYECFYLAAALLRDTALVTADHRFAAQVAGHHDLAGRVEILGKAPTRQLRR